MNTQDTISQTSIDAEYKKLEKEATQSGYFLNPDIDHTKALIESLLINEKRYGYWACPCRLAEGEKQDDLDIICPCDYRDADLTEFDTCFCGLYVGKDVYEGKKHIEAIPERRPLKKDRLQYKKEKSTSDSLSKTSQYPVWRCRVCGYLCARDDPPGICPICKAKKERFERF